MKWVLFFIAFVGSLSYSQGLYVDLAIYHIDQYGNGAINYNFYTDNCTWVQFDNEYSAKIKYPDGTWSDWQYSEVGGWGIHQAGTYKFQGQALAWDICQGGSQTWRYTNELTRVITDNFAPATPQNFNVSFPLNQNPVLSWNANSEGDLSGYRVYMKYNGGAQLLNEFTENTSYTDNNFSANVKFGEDVAEYWVVAEDINNNVSAETQHHSGGGSITAWKRNVSKEDDGIPYVYSLAQNFPNPFNPVTTISYSLQENGFVTLKIYDLLGNEVADLVNERQEAGNHSVRFDALNLPSGIYIYNLKVNNFVQNRKMTLMK